MALPFEAVGYYFAGLNVKENDWRYSLQELSQDYFAKLQFIATALSAATLLLAAKEIKAKVLSTQNGALIAVTAATVTLLAYRITSPKPPTPKGNEKLFRSPTQKALDLLHYAQIATSVALVTLSESKFYYLLNLTSTTFSLIKNRSFHYRMYTDTVILDGQAIEIEIVEPDFERLRKEPGSPRYRPNAPSATVHVSFPESPEEGVYYQRLFESAKALYTLFQVAITYLSTLPAYSANAYSIKCISLIPDAVDFVATGYLLYRAVREKYEEVDKKKLAAIAVGTGTLLLSLSIGTAFLVDPYLRGSGNLSEIAKAVSSEATVTWGAPTLVILSQGLHLGKLALSIALYKVSKAHRVYSLTNIGGEILNLYGTARLPWIRYEMSRPGPYFLNYGTLQVTSYALLHEVNETALKAMKSFTSAILTAGNWVLWKDASSKRWYEAMVPGSSLPSPNTLFTNSYLTSCFASAARSIPILLRWNALK